MVQAEGGESGAQAGAEEKIGKLRRCEGWLKVAVLGWGLLMIGAVLSLAGSSIYYGATYDGPEGDWQGGSKCLGRYRQLPVYTVARVRTANRMPLGRLATAWAGKIAACARRGTSPSSGCEKRPLAAKC